MPRVVDFRVGTQPVQVVYLSGSSWRRPAAAATGPEPIELHVSEFSMTQVSGNTYAGRAVLKAHPAEVLKRAVISVRDASNGKFDFGAVGPVEVGHGGVVLSGQREFQAAGQYTYTISVQKQDSKWYNLIRPTPFTVG